MTEYYVSMKCFAPETRSPVSPADAFGFQLYKIKQVESV